MLIRSGDNTYRDIVDGLTVTALQTTSESVQVNVQTDNESIKETVRAAQTMGLQEGIDMLNAQGLPTVKKLYNSEDMHEGALAFAEKRKPQWKGK